MDLLRLPFRLRRDVSGAVTVPVRRLALTVPLATTGHRRTHRLTRLRVGRTTTSHICHGALTILTATRCLGVLKVGAGLRTSCD